MFLHTCIKIRRLRSVLLSLHSFFSSHFLFESGIRDIEDDHFIQEVETVGKAVTPSSKLKTKSVFIFTKVVPKFLYFIFYSKLGITDLCAPA